MYTAFITIVWALEKAEEGGQFEGLINTFDFLDIHRFNPQLMRDIGGT
jgi:hypothetical protein